MITYVLDPLEQPRAITAEALASCTLLPYRASTQLSDDVLDEMLIVLPDGHSAWMSVDDLSHALFGVHGSEFKHWYHAIWGEAWRPPPNTPPWELVGSTVSVPFGCDTAIRIDGGAR